MGNPLLLMLRLEGPLQSWGTRARWDVRDSGDEPTKSGVIGLLGCALGYGMYHRSLEDELDANLNIGVRIERPGEPLLDFHTVTGILPTAEGKTKGRDGDPSTIVSHRTYLQDAAFLVVVGGPAGLLERCHTALAHPRWPVFLGRKSCPPSRPVLEDLSSNYESITDALHRFPWSCQTMELLEQRPTLPLRFSIEDSAGVRRQDATRINPARMYGSRRVRQGWVNSISVITQDQSKEGAS